MRLRSTCRAEKGVCGRWIAVSFGFMILLVLPRVHSQDEEVESKPELIASVDLTVTNSNEKGEPVQRVLPIQLFRGEDVPAATCRFYIKGEGQSIMKVDRGSDPKHVAKMVLDVAGILQNGMQNKEYESGIEMLRSAGAYTKRAAEHTKDERHLDAAADIVRALQRPGLDPQAKDRIERQLADALREATAQREAEDKAQREAEELERRLRAEEEAMEEARLRRERDEADWAAFAAQLRRDLALPADPAAPGSAGAGSAAAGGGSGGGGGGGADDGDEDDDGELVSLDLTVTGTRNGQQYNEAARVVQGRGQTAAEAAFHFCSARSLHAADEVTKIARMLADRAPPGRPGAGAAGGGGGGGGGGAARPGLGSAAEYMARGIKSQEEGAFAAAGADFAAALHSGGLSEAAAAECKARLDAMLRAQQALARAAGPFLNGGGGAAALMLARCYQQMGRWADVVRVTGVMLQGVAARGAWLRGQPRMMAVALGSQAAMELGDSEKALKFYQLVLRNDPDQEEVGRQYKLLRGLAKLLKDAEDKLTKSLNHKALAVLEAALSAMKGMDVGSGLLRSDVLLKLCRAQSELKRHEEAILSCDQSVQRRSTPVAGLFVDPKKLSEALAARAHAHMQDRNYDEAVRDFREAKDNAQRAGKHEEVSKLEGRLMEAQQAQKQWQDRRDHRAVLELPVNLHQLARDKQCTWVKKQHKLLARKWHPDKAKGDKQRASRKMREVSEAKEALTNELGC